MDSLKDVIIKKFLKNYLNVHIVQFKIIYMYKGYKYYFYA